MYPLSCVLRSHRRHGVRWGIYNSGALIISNSIVDAIHLHFDNLNGELQRNSDFDYLFSQLSSTNP
jgi:hypothetical protein